jgi:hypothetical protein
MQQNRYTPSHKAVVELEVMALLLLEPAKLPDRLALILASLPSELDDSLLVEFAEICRDCNFDDQQILSHYREREEGKVVFERLFSQGEDDESRVDVERNNMTSLARLREFYIDGAKELQRQQLLARMQEVSQYLTDPTLATDKLQHYYAELKEINESLKARDAERRMRMPSNRVKKRHLLHGKVSDDRNISWGWPGHPHEIKTLCITIVFTLHLSERILWQLRVAEVRHLCELNGEAAQRHRAQSV